MNDKKKVIISRIVGKRLYHYITLIKPERLNAAINRLKNVVGYVIENEENKTFKSDTEKILHFLKEEYPNSFSVDEIKKKTLVNISTESIARILRMLAKKGTVKKIKRKNKIMEYKLSIDKHQ